MRLVKHKDFYIAQTSYEEKEIPKSAGFRWDAEAKVWWTKDSEKACELYKFATSDILSHLKELYDKKYRSIQLSKATDSQLDIPKPEGLEYLPYQKAGVSYSIGRNSALIADEMGLGKTIEAIGVANHLKVSSVLVICPASLKLNWKREWQKWNIQNHSIDIAKDSVSGVNVVIVNYDILKKLHRQIRSRQWDLVIFDESHYLKNSKAQRTKEALDKKDPIPAKRRLFLTGTPILNRPIELWPILAYTDPTGLGKNFWAYAKRYCNAYHDGFGWNVKGSSHSDELQKKLRTRLMIRRLKSDVMKELPPKRRQVIELPANGLSDVLKKEKEVWNKHQGIVERLNQLMSEAGNDEEYKEQVSRLKREAAVAFEEMAAVRHETALAKVPYVISHIKDSLESGDKVVVFGHHLDVLGQIHKAFPKMSVMMTGETSLKDRQDAVDSFQNDDSVRLFVGSTTAAGLGITLTASSHVIFGELDWVPANLTQAEDRLHRIGQENSVLVQHLVLEESIDAYMARTVVSKQDVITKTLDEEAPKQEEEATKVEKEIVKAKENKPTSFTKEQLNAIHRGLKVLAGICDYATSWDNAGFNKMDADFGHSLANSLTLTQRQAKHGLRMINKYRRQLPEDIVEEAKGAK